MTRIERHEATYTALVRDSLNAFEKAYQWFPSSHYWHRHYQSCERKRAAYNAKYGPFEVVINAR